MVKISILTISSFVSSAKIRYYHIPKKPELKIINFQTEKYEYPTFLLRRWFYLGTVVMKRVKWRPEGLHAEIPTIESIYKEKKPSKRCKISNKF